VVKIMNIYNITDSELRKLLDQRREVILIGYKEGIAPTNIDIRIDERGRKVIECYYGW